MASSVKAFFDQKVPAVLTTSPEKAKDVARRGHLDGRPRGQPTHLRAGGTG
jgi:hypothetical protein